MFNVFVNESPVGGLGREAAEGGRQRFRFEYRSAAPASDAVSLLMPPAGQPYITEDNLHPVFDMNLPEGELREAISRLFAKALPTFDDFALLQVVGGSLIGRLRFGEAAALPKAENIRSMLEYRGTADLFRGLLERYAQNSGVSGVQPKLLVRDDGSLVSEQFSPLKPADRMTASGTTHIIKTFDPLKYPGLAANEFLCMQAAKAAGLAVPKINLAADGGILAVERFDLKADGTYRAFEDGCSLAGRGSSGKYEGSYEQLAGMFGKVLRSPGGVRAELRSLFQSIALSMTVLNGDAHRKNFGVLYDDATKDIRLAPVYDVLTTHVYMREDPTALTLDGKKLWPDIKRMERFGVQRCQLAPEEAKDALAQVVQAVADTRPAIGTVGLSKIMAAQMMEAWENGLARLGAKGSAGVTLVALPSITEAPAKHSEGRKS